MSLWVAMMSTAPMLSAGASLSDEVRTWWRAHGRFQLLTQGTLRVQQPADSRLNFGNLLRLPRYRTEIEIRPDLALATSVLRATLEPRLDLYWERLEDGGPSGEEERDAELYVNGASVDLRLQPDVYLSYLRDSMQWGPSYLISPSNPFSRENGLDNPREELPGRDFLTASWLPAPLWSVVALAEVGLGRDDYLRDFEQTYAIKVDVTAMERQLGLVLSNEVHGAKRIGGHASFSPLDAWLFWAEGGVEDDGGRPEVLLGASYTFRTGATLILEAFRDGDGCTHELIDRCLIGRAASVEPGDIYFRRHYTLLQWIDPDVLDDLALYGRWIHNYDDHSNRLIGMVEVDLFDSAQLFIIGHADTGGPNDELGALIEASGMIGMSWVY